MMDIWERLEGDEEIYRCPMCRGLSYVRLNYCPSCSEHMRTANGKIRIDVGDKVHLGTRKIFARVRDDTNYYKGKRTCKTKDCTDGGVREFTWKD